MEIEVKIKIAMPDEVANTLGIDEDSVLESYYEDGYIYICKVDDDELDELAHEYDDCTDCEGCEMFCPHCQNCILDD
jgi:hypothetical protein